MTAPSADDDRAPRRLWAYASLPAARPRAAGDLPAGLVTVASFGAAVRRRAWLCCVMAAAGLALGVGVYIKAPPPYRASASVLLTQPATENPLDAVQADVALGQTRAVAAGALRRLNLTESVTDFLGAYAVTALTDRVVLITVDAPSSGQAVRVAAALATSFLQFRNTELEAQQQLQMTSLGQQIAHAKQALAATVSQITDVSGHPASPSRRAELSLLRQRHRRAAIALAGLQLSAATYAVTTASSIAGSGVLDPAAPLPRSQLRAPVLYGVAGLIIGLALGLGIVIVGNPAGR